MLTDNKLKFIRGKNMLGLYIHIPFCSSICPYCDFYKMVASKKTKEEYIDALLTEMIIKKLNNYKIDTLYIGGGTPTSLSMDLLERLFNGLNKYINLKTLKEFTIEVNPNDLTMELIDLLKKYHLTRISIGVQTFNSRLQKIINRPFNLIELKKKINLLKNNGLSNINLDLIYSIPTESLQEFDNDLDIAISLDVPHLSVYSLILEEHTIFYHQYLKGNLKLNSDDLEAKMYNHLCNKLKKHNFIHYETSNFSKKSYQSLHNLIYWNCDEYLALGTSSASYHNSVRSTTTKNIKKYLEGIRNNSVILEEQEFISKDESKKEFVILGLRKIKGISKRGFALRYDENLKDAFLPIQSLIEEGLLKENKDYIYIPRKYFYISNHIIVKILSE